MSKYKIVVTDYYYPNFDIETRVLKQLGDETEVIDCTKIIPGGAKTPEQLLPFVKGADALIVQFAKINSQVIDQMDRCKVIARYAIGVDNIDVEAATRKNIYVANAPGYCANEVADTAIAHILNAMRRITRARDLLLQGSFTMDAIQPMKRLEDCTIGLLGFGNIARNLANKIEPFFKKLIVFDPYFSNQKEYPRFNFLPFEEVLAKADVISIHVPLNDSTRNSISKKEFDLMRNGVVLVNTSRGAIIDEPALLKALESGKVGFCGLDVLATEDFMNSPLLRHPFVAITPHIAWSSEGSRADLQEKTAENVVATLLKGRPINSVNLS